MTKTRGKSRVGLERLGSTSWRWTAAASVVTLNGAGAALWWIFRAIGVSVPIGWGIIAGMYLVALIFGLFAVRVNRDLSPAWRFTRGTCVVLYGSAATGLIGWSLWQLSHQALAKGYPPLQAAYLAGYYGIWFGGQGIGLVYALLLLVLSRALRKYEREMVAAIPLEVGDAVSMLATESEVKAAGLFKPNSVTIGEMNNKQIQVPLREQLIVAPQGSGKGTTVVVPALLQQERSIITTDPKAQNFAVTSGARVSIGYKPTRTGGNAYRTLYVADPYRLHAQPGFHAPGSMMEGRIVEARLNVFDIVDVANEQEVDRRIDAATDAVLSPLPDTAGQEAQYFREQARTLIRGIAWAGKVSEARGQGLDGSSEPVSPAWVRDTLIQASADLAGMIGWLRQSGRYGAEAAGVLARAGDREQGGIYNSALLGLKWVEDTNIRRAVSHTTINWDLVCQGLADLFVICPADQFKTKRQWLFGLLKCMFVVLQSQGTSKRPPKDLLGLWDELGQLGHCAPIEEAAPIIRDYGFRQWFIFQSPGQQKPYSSKDVFKSDVTRVFGSNDEETIAWLCKAAGKRKVMSWTITEGGQAGVHDQRNMGLQEGRTITEKLVDVLTPDVVRGLAGKAGIALISGLDQPVSYPLRPYYRDPKLARMARPDPYQAVRKES